MFRKLWERIKKLAAFFVPIGARIGAAELTRVALVVPGTFLAWPQIFLVCTVGLVACLFVAYLIPRKWHTC